MVEIENLENNDALSLLITLQKIGEKTYHDKLRKEAKIGINTLNRRLLELKAIDLINEETENKFGGRRYIWLTPKGKKIAEKLVEIEEILNEK